MQFAVERRVRPAIRLKSATARRGEFGRIIEPDGQYGVVCSATRVSEPSFTVADIQIQTFIQGDAEQVRVPVTREIGCHHTECTLNAIVLRVMPSFSLTRISSGIGGNMKFVSGAGL